MTFCDRRDSRDSWAYSNEPYYGDVSRDWNANRCYVQDATEIRKWIECNMTLTETFYGVMTPRKKICCTDEACSIGKV